MKCLMAFLIFFLNHPKVLDALDVLRKKSEAEAGEILPIEKLIAEDYSVIDKAVKVGTRELVESHDLPGERRL
ncbi:hypothetical protein GQ457_07G014840 [Hibiscus cannabinus]